MFAIVDYQGGNLASVKRALEYLGYDAEITDDPDRIRASQAVIPPGVGGAGQTMSNLNRLGLDEVIRDDIVGQGVPFLGICIGVQVTLSHSAEDGGTDCLGLIPGQVRRFPSQSDSERLKVPQIGWNRVRFVQDHPVFEGVHNDQVFYFVNSYYPDPDSDDHALATTEYGVKFASVVGNGSLVATQFHLEKSGEAGLKMLDNFCRWSP